MSLRENERVGLN